ncbi:MAG TPA: hypothetical protein PLZ24_16155 [Flavobacteriales bacterium]|nr:hypothetical protein [Flavobacteriales bacterium]
METKAIGPTFEEVMIARIRKDMGDLMPEEALKAILERSVEKIFFEPTRTPQSYGSDKLGPSWLEVECEKLLKSQMQDILKKHLQENPEAVKKALNDALDKGIVAAFSQAFTSMMSSATQDMAYTITKKLTGQ